MDDRPAVSSEVLATVIEDAPDRVRRRLDRESAVAANWNWRLSSTVWTIDTGSESVRLKATDGIVASGDDVSCSCLLSPRCFHLLACLSVLNVSAPRDDPPITTHENAADSATRSNASDSVTVDETQVAAASRLFDELARLLAVGARSAGSLTQAQVMRALHECRSLGLHRLAAVGLRVLQQVRQLRDADDHFDSSALVRDLAESFELAWRLATSSDIDPDWVGTARRAYFPIQSLSLQALFTEPVLTASGHSGVVTYLLDQSGEIYSVSNVRPGDASRIRDAWQTGIDLAGLSVSHRDLSQSGLLLQRGTASRDGRLGGAQNSRAITSQGAGWNAPAVARAFTADFDDQISRVFDAARNTLTARRAGWDFLFLQGRVLGTDGRSLVFQTSSGRHVMLTVSQHHESLSFLSNIELLSRCPGLALRVIARLNVARANSASLLAIAPAVPADTVPADTVQEPDDVTEPPPELCLTQELTGSVSLGLEKLARGHVTCASREPVIVPASDSLLADSVLIDDGLSALRRRVRELALCGRHSLPTTRLGALAGEASLLAAESRPTAAALLQNLASLATETAASFSGHRFPADPTPLAQIWLACARYESSSSAEFHRALWRHDQFPM